MLKNYGEYHYSMYVLLSGKLKAKPADFIITVQITFLLLLPKMQKELSNLFKKKYDKSKFYSVIPDSSGVFRHFIQTVPGVVSCPQIPDT